MQRLACYSVDSGTEQKTHNKGKTHEQLYQEVLSFDGSLVTYCGNELRSSPSHFCLLDDRRWGYGGTGQVGLITLLESHHGIQPQ